MTSSQPNLQLRQAARHLSPFAVHLLNVLFADLTAAAFANSCVRSCNAAAEQLLRTCPERRLYFGISTGGVVYLMNPPVALATARAFS